MINGGSTEVTLKIAYRSIVGSKLHSLLLL